MSHAVIFPGQGAQVVGMGKELAASIKECRALFDRASDVLGYDMAEICFEGPAERLTASDRAQPAIFVVSAAAYAALQIAQPDLEVSAVAGLSSGEWCALYVAGVISYDDTLRVLEARGRFMQEACVEHPGTMLSVIGLTPEALKDICIQTGVEIANLNSPEQTVLSGSVSGIDEAEKQVKEAGAKRAIRLSVAGAFHSSLMAPAARKFEKFIEQVDLKPPKYPVMANVTGRKHGSSQEIRQYMVQQITASVRWVDCVQGMRNEGISHFIECGPGKVLSGLIKRIDKQASLHNISDPSTLNLTVDALI